MSLSTSMSVGFGFDIVLTWDAARRLFQIFPYRRRYGALATQMYVEALTPYKNIQVF